SKQGGEGDIWVLRPPGNLQLRALSGSLAVRRHGLHQQIKELWRAAGVPPWQRRQWPLLFRDGDVVSVPLVGLADGEDSDNSERWYLLPSTAMSH
ncbi:tRNA lysidine(34) synthetase TilS, partial [Alcanivorax sp. HI0083]